MFARTAFRRALLCLSLASVLFATACITAAEPTIGNLNVRGLQIGGVTKLVIDGEDLGAAPRLLLPFPAKQELQPGSTDKQATFLVTPEGSVSPSYEQLRVVTDSGVSLPLVIGVDRLPQLPLAATVESLPVALHGAVGGSSVVETKFPGKAGQHVIVEVEAQRLGSKLRPVIHLSNPKGRQLGWSWPMPALQGDSRLEVTLPEDGQYTLALHDAEYGPPGPGFFRLKLGEWSFVDQVFPPVVPKGLAQGMDLLGMLSPARSEFPAAVRPGIMPLPWPADGLWSGPRAQVRISSHAELLEQVPANGLQVLPPGMIGVSGRLLAPSEEDRYQLTVSPGSRLRLEVFAERYGSPLDVALLVRNEKGDLLARVEDGVGTMDPNLEYAVPDGVNAIVVGVADALGSGGPRGVYRLTVEPISPAKSKNDFVLTTPVQRISLPLGGRFVLPIYAERRGYQGAISLTANSLTAGIGLEGAAIPVDADGTLMTLQRGEESGEPIITTWQGSSIEGEVRPVAISGHLMTSLQPWLASEVAVALTTGKAADFTVDWRDLPAEAALFPAGKLSLPIKLTRPTSDSVVRLSLHTSQPPLLVNGQPDLNRMLRVEAQVELAANVLEGAVSLLVPGDLLRPGYEVSVQAELLTPDKRAVIASSFTPVRRLPVRHQLAVRLASPQRIEVPLHPQTGATYKIAGTIERREGLVGDVTINVAGLPIGARADAVVVKADMSDFVITLILPANLSAGELPGVSLFATAPLDPKQPGIIVRSPDTGLKVVVLRAAP